MRISVRARNLDMTQSISEHVRNRIHAALNQHADRVRDVRVQLSDINGPRGGRDQQCRVAVRLSNGELLVHERLDYDLYANVSLLADTIKRRVGDYVARMRSRRSA